MASTNRINRFFDNEAVEVEDDKLDEDGDNLDDEDKDCLAEDYDEDEESLAEDDEEDEYSLDEDDEAFIDDANVSRPEEPHWHRRLNFDCFLVEGHSVTATAVRRQPFAASVLNFARSGGDALEVQRSVNLLLGVDEEEDEAVSEDEVEIILVRPGPPLRRVIYFRQDDDNEDDVQDASAAADKDDDNSDVIFVCVRPAP